jgi:two-component system, NarL family, sensor kinase
MPRLPVTNTGFWPKPSRYIVFVNCFCTFILQHIGSLMYLTTLHQKIRLALFAAFVFITSIQAATAQDVRTISISPMRLNRDSATVNAILQHADNLSGQIFTDSVFTLYSTANRIAKQIGYNRAVVYTACKMGDFYFNKKRQYRQSKSVLYEALHYLSKLNANDRKRFVPMTCNLLANALYMNGQNDSAIHYYSVALNAMQTMGVNNPGTLVQVYSNMGAVLSASGQHVKGIEYLKKTLTLPNVDSTDLGKNYGNLGALYANFLNNMDSATYWWRKAIPIHKALGHTKELQDIYANMGTGWTLMLHQDIAKAQRYFDTAVAIDTAAVWNNIMLQQGLSATSYFRGNYAEAIKHARRTLEIAAYTGDREKELYAYWTLSYSYAHLGDTQKTHEYQRRLSFLDDTLRNEKIMHSISESESKYRLFEKNNELAQNKARLYRQQLWLTGGLGGGIILIGALLSILLYTRQKQRLQLDRLRNMEQQQKIGYLYVKMEAEESERARIARELHDGLGVLLSAAKVNHNLLGKSLSEEQKHNTAFTDGGEIITQIYAELRSVTQNLIPDYIAHKSLEDALEVLTAKLDTPAFRIAVQSYGQRRELHPETSFAIYRALEEIVNNAVKHSGSSELMLQLLYHDDKLHITTEDNGQGFDTRKSYPGLGLSNIIRRIEKIGGYVTLSSTPDKGTLYVMEIPY